MQYPGAICYVIDREDRRKGIFKDDQDRDRFPETFGTVWGKLGRAGR